MNVFGITNVGLVRKQNQDYYYTSTGDNTLLAVVCDGMGGARSGNVASKMAVETFAEEFTACTSKRTRLRMKKALAAANDAVFSRSLSDPDCNGMGTTMVATYIQADKKAYVLNVGDSRAYLIKPDGISQITTDHSLVANLVAQGKITPEEARTHPNRNIITRAVGTEEHTSCDIFELKLKDDQYILMCSDGLSNMVNEQEILFEILYGGSLETCCQRLLDIALERGATDNVTVVLIAAGNEDDN